MQERNLFAVGPVTADRVNLLANDFAAGLPSPGAALGLAAAMAPKLGCGRWKIDVLPVFHEVTPSPGRTKPEMIAKGGAFVPAETPEDFVGRVRFSLLLAVPGNPSDADVARALRSKNFAGGRVERWPEARRANPDQGALRGVARGYALIPAQGGMASVASSGDLGRLSAVAAALYRNDEPGWRVPVAAGYRLLEDPATAPRRANTRTSEVPHVFAEPVVGIGELVSVRNPRLTALGKAEFFGLFWKWRAQGAWVVFHPAYLPNQDRGQQA